jgi:hypothetical protein
LLAYTFLSKDKTSTNIFLSIGALTGLLAT